MKRFLLFAGILLLILGFAFIVGCSDDDDDNGVTGPTPGDPNDPEFIMASDIIGEGFLDHDNTILELSFFLVDYIPGKSIPGWLTKPTAVEQYLDSLDYTYSYSNYWHVFTVYARLIDFGDLDNDTLIYTGVDSLRFGNPEGYMQYPDPTTTTLDIRAHFDAEFDMNDAYAVISSDVAFTVTGSPEEEIVINGTSADTLDGYFQNADTTCDMYMTSNQTATNLTIDPDAMYDCPSSGTLDVNATLDISCMADTASMEFSSAWTITFTFNDGTITIRYVSGGNVWTITEQCDPYYVKRGIAGVLKRLSERF